MHLSSAERSHPWAPEAPRALPTADTGETSKYDVHQNHLANSKPTAAASLFRAGSLHVIAGASCTRELELDGGSSCNRARAVNPGPIEIINHTRECSFCTQSLLNRLVNNNRDRENHV